MMTIHSKLVNFSFFLFYFFIFLSLEMSNLNLILILIIIGKKFFWSIQMDKTKIFTFLIYYIEEKLGLSESTRKLFVADD